MWVPQCSGYHVSFTRTRSPVRSRQEPKRFILLFLTLKNWPQLSIFILSICLKGPIQIEIGIIIEVTCIKAGRWFNIYNLTAGCHRARSNGLHEGHKFPVLGCFLPGKQNWPTPFRSKTGSLVQGYDSRLGCERSRVQIPDEPNCFKF